jgi:hypothetical protein
VSKKQTIPPNHWVDVGFGLQVLHRYETNKTVSIFGGGTVDLSGEWRVRSVGVQQIPKGAEK